MHCSSSRIHLNPPVKYSRRTPCICSGWSPSNPFQLGRPQQCVQCVESPSLSPFHLLTPPCTWGRGQLSEHVTLTLSWCTPQYDGSRATHTTVRRCLEAGWHNFVCVLWSKRGPRGEGVSFQQDLRWTQRIVDVVYDVLHCMFVPQFRQSKRVKGGHSHRWGTGG